MTQDRISVRQWQELYRAGAFEKDNEQTRELAGWGGVDDPLNNWRMKKLSRLVLAVTHPFILDNYRVFFSVGQPNVGHKYGLRILSFLTLRFLCPLLLPGLVAYQLLGAFELFPAGDAPIPAPVHHPAGVFRKTARDGVRLFRLE